MNKALFLDRDGIINIDKGYVYRKEEFEFVEGIFDVCRIASDKGYLLIVVTNQAGIGRGYYTEDDFQELSRWMSAEFASRSLPITAIYHCPFHSTGGVGEYKVDSYDRKPNPGMILRAQREHNLDLSESILVGDKESDIEAAANAGVECSVLVQAKTHVVFSKATLSFASLLLLYAWIEKLP